MDWDYIYSLTPEDLAEEEKDDLFNTVTWFNTENEELTLRKSSTLLKLSQEILKHKGEQVEILLSKLDELATQQGEDEGRKTQESDTDGKSSRSRKSSSMEFENLEQNYLELRSKYKKLTKNNEKLNNEMGRMKLKISDLEQEKRRLITDMQVLNQDDNQSDVSESVRDQHKELIQTVQNKNRQISELLRDIEETEKDNTVLREKLTAARDELLSATKELSSLTEAYKHSQVQISESSEMIRNLTAENEHLEVEANEVLEQKLKFEREMEEFTEEVNVRVDEWKRILQEKQREIDYLVSQQPQNISVHSSSSSLLQERQPLSHTSTLNKILSDREKQIMDLKTKLQESVTEMVEGTEVIKNLKREKDSFAKKTEELSSSVRDLKKKLKSTHERCQELQDLLSHAEKTIEIKNAHLKEVVKRIKDDDYELGDTLEQLQLLKEQNRIQEIEIMKLVKASNKLQEHSDQYERENEVLRHRLGLSEDEVVNSSGSTFKQKQQKKKLDSFQKQLETFEEERLILKTQIRKLTKINASLNDRILELGEKPQVEVIQVLKSAEEHSDSSEDEIKALVEENEALRKGMHEILNDLNSRKETILNEVKSDTFEKLLRALDVKHISGWYHPAMRLQAELHNQQGINAELREQLRLARVSAKSSLDDNIERDEIDWGTFLGGAENCDNLNLKKVQDYVDHLIIKIDLETEKGTETESQLAEYKSDLNEIGHQMKILYDEYLTEIQSLKESHTEMSSHAQKLEETNEIYSAKVKLLEDNLLQDELKAKTLELIEQNVTLSRKCTFYENEVKAFSNQINILQNDLGDAKKKCLFKINDLTRKNGTLTSKLEIVNVKLQAAIDPEKYEKLRFELDALTIKYRNLLHDYEEIPNHEKLEFKILEQSRHSLDAEKCELKLIIVDLCEKSHKIDSTFSDNIDSRVSELSKKLSQSEMNEITERQRANHTNNLYELVKEQLEKSENNCKRYERQTKDMMEKNIELQKCLKVLESKVCDYVVPSTFTSLQSKYNELLIESDKLRASLSSCEEKRDADNENHQISHKWSLAKEQEVLALKHLIVDLQAASADKMLITRLSTELNQIKEQLEESNVKQNQLNAHLEHSEEECENFRKKLESLYLEIQNKDEDYKKKFGMVRDLLDNQRLQYMGCVPLISQEKFVDKLKSALIDKHEAFINWYNSQMLYNESGILKEQYKDELKRLEAFKSDSVSQEKMVEVLTTFGDSRQLRFNEIKYRRQCELKESQLKHVFGRLKIQDEHIMKLEEELFSLHQNYNISLDFEPDIATQSVKIENKSERISPSQVKLTKSTSSQTDEEDTHPDENVASMESKISSLRSELLRASNDLTSKDQTIQQLKSKLTEHEMNISLFRKQLGDKQSQITFYERHILELQGKKDVSSDDEPNSLANNEETISLKCSLESLQEISKQKDEEILKYQNLIKDDRDKHSMAATLMRDELKLLQRCLSEEKQRSAELNQCLSEIHPSKTALEQYFQQVHSLENELAQLRTKSSSLETQLQASRDEAVRWRTLANDRLESMQKLGSDLEESHRNEIEANKKDAEKWREGVNNLKLVVGKYKHDVPLESEFQRLLKEKDDKIHELTIMMRQARHEVRKIAEKPLDNDSQSKISLLESTNEQLVKEHEGLKKRCEQLVLRERNSREEIRDLRGKLLKKPILSARSDRSDKNIKDQLQRKISSLESEILELKENLSRQVAINESHRIKISEDFDRWNKQKHWQQTAEKLKEKLKVKELDFDKLQQTCAGYRILIERMEREKYNLETKVKSLKICNSQSASNEIEMLRIENMKLISENETLLCKLEMQQHHAGALGAAMLQEKLEAQERKIAILELAAKGPTELRAELERIQSSMSTLQKSNLRLEAENLDLKLDGEKSSTETPHLREQIQHLESYVEVLKKENISGHGSETNNDPRIHSKKISELERTIFILKRVVEKLQAENRRLLTGKQPLPERSSSTDKLRRDYHKLKEQYCEALQKIARLEHELDVDGSDQNKPVNETFSTLSAELTQVKGQLNQKSHLLNKVKVLLQQAAAKERELLQQITELKGQQGDESQSQSETS